MKFEYMIDGGILIMKINFIRQISDDILKENHELRTSLILARQQLQNFQDNMNSFIRESHIQAPILTTPHQTLTLFMKTVHSRIADYQLELKKQEVASKMLAQATNELQLKDKQLKKERVEASNRENRWKQEFDSIQKRYYEMEKKASAFQSIEYSLKQEIKSIKQKSIMERNILEQMRKKQVQGTRLACHNQLLEIRDRIQSQNVELEKKYQGQIAEKDKRIKELQKLMEKMSANIKLDNTDTSILSSVLQAFQQSAKLKKIIDDHKTQNAAIKKQLSEAQKQKRQLESKLMQKNIILHNLQGELQQQKMGKVEFQRNLRAKIKQYQKSEKDKQAMEQYYEKKWNSDFKKVRSHLEKAFQQKSEELEAAYAGRMKEFQGKMVQWLEKVNSYQFKNKELEKIHNLDRKQTQRLRKEIQQLKIQKQELSQELEQTWKMTREQLIQQKFVAIKEKEVLKNQIKSLKKELESKQNNIQSQTEKIQLIIKELSENHTIQLTKLREQQEKLFIAENEVLKSNYEQKITRLNESMRDFEMEIKNAKEQARKQFQKQLEAIKQRHQKQLKQKVDEALKKLQKTAHKLRDCQIKLATSKKQTDEMLLSLERQRSSLQKQVENLKNKLQNSEIQMKQGLQDRKQMNEVTKLLESKIESFKEMISIKNKQIQALRAQKYMAENQKQQLSRKRGDWLDELKKVQSQYKRQFQELKAMFQRQLNMYKSKVWELQGNYKKQYMSKKNYEKMLSLYSEKQELQNALEIKQAQNIVLSQVKNFYEAQIEMNDVKVTASQHKAAKTYFTRKVDRHRKYTEKREQKNQSNTDSKEVMQMRKYIKQSQKKQVYLSLAKSRYREYPDFERVKTNPV